MTKPSLHQCTSAKAEGGADADALIWKCAVTMLSAIVKQHQAAQVEVRKENGKYSFCLASRGVPRLAVQRDPQESPQSRSAHTDHRQRMKVAAVLLW